MSSVYGRKSANMRLTRMAKILSTSSVFLVFLSVIFVKSSVADGGSDNSDLFQADGVNDVLESLAALGDKTGNTRDEEDNLKQLSEVNKVKVMVDASEDADHHTRQTRGYYDEHPQARKGQRWRGKSKSDRYRGKSNPPTGYRMMSDGVGMDYAEYQTEKLHSDLLKLYEKVLDELMERDKLKDKVSTLEKNVEVVPEMRSQLDELQKSVESIKDAVGVGDNSIQLSINGPTSRQSANKQFADATMHAMLLKQLRKLQNRADDQDLLLQDYRAQVQAQRAMIVSHAEMIEQCGAKLNLLNSEVDITKAKAGKLSVDIHWQNYKIETAENMTRSTRNEIVRMENAVSGLYADHGHFYDTTSTLEEDLKESKLDLRKLQSRTNMLENAVQRAIYGRESRNGSLAQLSNTTISASHLGGASLGNEPIAGMRYINLTQLGLIQNVTKQQNQLDELSLDVERIKDDVLSNFRQLKLVRGSPSSSTSPPYRPGGDNLTVTPGDLSRGLDRLRQKVSSLESTLRLTDDCCRARGKNGGRKNGSGGSSAERNRGKPRMTSAEMHAENMNKDKKHKHKNGRHGHGDDDVSGNRSDNEVIDDDEDYVTQEPELNGYSAEGVDNMTTMTSPAAVFGSIENKLTSEEMFVDSGNQLGLDPSLYRDKEQDICAMVGIKLGRPRTVATFPGVVAGSWMRDPEARDNHIFVLKDNLKVNHVREYNREDSIIRGNATYVHKLPFACTGTGHVMYNGSLYCHRYGANKLVKYHMTSHVTVTKRLPGAGFNNSYAYSVGGHTDIDFAVDEIGLWVIYASKTSRGMIQVAKLDPETLEVQQEWRTNFPKREATNSFMICGRLYVVQPVEKDRLSVTYMYDTRSVRGKRVPRNRLLLKANAKNLYMLAFNPKDSQLYAWEWSDQTINGNLVNYDVYFTSDPL